MQSQQEVYTNEFYDAFCAMFSTICAASTYYHFINCHKEYENISIHSVFNAIAAGTTVYNIFSRQKNRPNSLYVLSACSLASSAAEMYFDHNNYTPFVAASLATISLLFTELNRGTFHSKSYVQDAGIFLDPSNSVR